METLKVFLLISALGVAVVPSWTEEYDDDYDLGFYDFNDTVSFQTEEYHDNFPDYGTVSSRDTSDFKSVSSSAAKPSPQRGAVVTKYSLCLLPVISHLCLKD